MTRPNERSAGLLMGAGGRIEESIGEMRVKKAPRTKKDGTNGLLFVPGGQ
jgi:hypothetical protein